MTDLRDQLADRMAACHPQRRHKARGLCTGCYGHHLYAGTLQQHPLIRRTQAEFVADYTRLRAQGHSVRYVAYAIGMTIDGLNKAYYRAVAAGALTPDRRTVA